jgi:parallel beta-helix repeat protein
MKPVVILFVVAFVSAVSASVDARTWYVPSECPTIQAGIDSASAGDVVQVADGTYTGSGNKNLDFGGKAITVRSENGPDNCVIDCQDNGRGFCFSSGETLTSVVDGFTITNGNLGNGGGICCFDNSSPTITNCTITGSTCDFFGGGIDCENHSAPRIINCTITGNTTTEGGGIHSYWGSSPTIINCTIIGNSASSDGGGIFCYNAEATIINCTITGNTAAGRGGGLHCDYGSDVTVVNCVLWADAAPKGPEIALAGNDEYPTTLTVSYSDVQGGYAGTYRWGNSTLNWGAGNIAGDPLFVDAGNDNYHLSSSSPCIDAGSNDAVPPDVTTDLDGNPRIVDGDGDDTATVDMGAYEAGPPTYNVTIEAYCYTEGAPVGVSITVDGSPTGYNTPHTFTGLSGTHTFTVPDNDPNEHAFEHWNTGETGTTITLTSSGTCIAYYGAIPVPMLTEWSLIALVVLVLLSTSLVLRRRKRAVSLR